MKKKSHLQEILDRYKNINLPAEYKTLMFDYIRFIYKWVTPINHVLDVVLRIDQQNTKATATYMKRRAELDNHIGQLCWLRDTGLVLLSFIVFIGMHVPNKKSLKDFHELKEILETAILDRLVVIERYKNYFLQHRRFSLKGIKVPMDCEAIQNSKYWPENEINAAAFANGRQIMGISIYKKEKI